MEGNILFEPSDKLPPNLRSVAPLNSGEKVTVRLDNSGVEEQLVDPGWETGTLQKVQQSDKGPAKKADIPEVPRDLTREQQEQLKAS